MLKLIIFAKRGTSEKVLMKCIRAQIGGAMEFLSKKYGGDWIFVDELKSGELLKFDDSEVYKGHTPKIKRYCSFIKNMFD